MWTINLSLSILLCLNIYANCEIHSDVEQNILLSGDATNNEARSDIEKKIENAKHYLSSLAKQKESWVDPYDMIASPVGETQSSSIKSEHAESVINEPNVEFDFRPLFSDIRGEVISPNSISKDDSDDHFTKNDGNLFSNGRHQICVLDSIYISRWLKKLISKIESDSELEPTALTIPLDSNSLLELKAMSTAKTLVIADVDEIMCSLITKATILRREAYDWTYISDLLVKTGIVMCICVAGYILYICLTNSPLYTFLCCFCFVNVFWHWMHLYQKQIASKHHRLSTIQIPSGCEKVELGVLEQIQVYFKSFFVSGDCLKYYEALMVNPVWEVSLSVAVSETFSAALFQPLYSASKAINASVKILFEDLTFLNMLILIIFLFMFFIMLCGYKLKFPFFMGSLEPGNVVHNYIEEVKSDSKPGTFDDLRIKSRKVLQNFKGSTSNTILSLPPGSTNLYKNDNSPIICSSISNDLPSKSSCHCLIKRFPLKEDKEPLDLNIYKSNCKNLPRYTEESFTLENTIKSGKNKSSSCYCDSEESVTVKRTKVEKHNECEIKTFDSDDQIYDSHVEVEESSFDHICAKCERDSLKQFSPNHDGCAECGKNDPD